MSTPRKTVYVVYATFNDAIRLYRSAKRKGYSYGTIEPHDPDDPNIKVIESGYKKITDSDGRTKEYPSSRDLEYIPAAGFYGYVLSFPSVLVYRDYKAKTLDQPDFELYKVTLTREY